MVSSLKDPSSRNGRSTFGAKFDELVKQRVEEADEFYRSVTPASASPDAANVMRQALAGMLWTKQYYGFDGDEWLKEHNAYPLQPDSRYLPQRKWSAWSMTT